VNIKELRLKLHTDEPVVMRVERKTQGPGEASDIVRRRALRDRQPRTGALQPDRRLTLKSS